MADGASTGPGKPPPRWLLKAVTRTHVLLHRLSGGRWFNRLGGDEVCFVVTGHPEAFFQGSAPLV